MSCFAKKLTELVFPAKTFTQYHHQRKGLFDDIYGYDNIKRLFRMALESTYPYSILLSGPPASAKTLFLQCLMKLHNSYFIDCSNATKSGVVDCIFDNKSKYLLLDELDKLSRKDQTFLLNLMETIKP
jgi:Holliday junction DNA helicase RuvB